MMTELYIHLLDSSLSSVMNDWNDSSNISNKLKKELFINTAHAREEYYIKSKAEKYYKRMYLKHIVYIIYEKKKS